MKTAIVPGFDGKYSISFYRPRRVTEYGQVIQPDRYGQYALSHPDTPEIAELLTSVQIHTMAYGEPVAGMGDYTITRTGDVYTEHGDLISSPRPKKGEDDRSVTLYWTDPDGTQRSRQYKVSYLLKMSYPVKDPTYVF